MNRTLLFLVVVFLGGSNLGWSASAPLPPGAVSWWQAEGYAVDFVGGNDGFLVGGATFGEGKVGSAFNFLSFGDIFEAPSAGLPVGNAPRTIEPFLRSSSLVIE